MSVEIISEYWSDNGRLKAEVVLATNEDFKSHLVMFYEDDCFLGSEHYSGHSLQYYEDAAENYVLGIKHLGYEGK